MISPLVGNTHLTVENTVDFVELIHQVEKKQGDIMVSFDVVSLFSCAPIPEAVSHLRVLLEGDIALHERTKLPVSTIISLVEFCMESTFFQYEDNIYQHKSGAPMGSPLSPLMANIFMDKLEGNLTAEDKGGPRVWLRYIDNMWGI